MREERGIENCPKNKTGSDSPEILIYLIICNRCYLQCVCLEFQYSAIKSVTTATLLKLITNSNSCILAVCSFYKVATIFREKGLSELYLNPNLFFYRSILL